MIKIVFIRGKLPYYYNAYDGNTTTLIAILFLLLSSPLPEFTEAQSDDGRPSPDAQPNPPSPFTGVTFLAFTGIIIFLMFIFYYFRESCIRRSTDISSAGIRATLGSSSQRRRGLDPAVLNTFPVYNYAEVKDLKEVVKKGQLECAVCLSAFEDDETLRLLPKCDHVFHPQCVDVWLESHTTCPYCRADLVPKPDDDDESNPRISILMAEYENNISGGGACSCDGGGIEIRSDDTVLRLEEGTGESASGGGGGTGWGSHSSNNFWRRSFQFRRFRSFGKLNRWNSTGHVADRRGKESERFTLRLPPELLIGLGVNQKQDEVVVLHRTRSCLMLPSTGTASMHHE